jgi:hypothetical protein
VTDPIPPDVIVGQFTYRMMPDHLAALGDVPKRIADILGKRVQAATVVTRPYDEMPLIRPELRARAIWRERSRRIVLSLPFAKYNVQATLGHETMHVLDDDWLTRTHRKAILPYMEPLPDGWGDLTIGDAPPRYEASPAECWASYGANAILGVPVAFSTLYDRRIPLEHRPQVRDLALSRLDPVDPAVIAELERQVAEAKAKADQLEHRTIELTDALLATATGIELSTTNLNQIAANARAKAQGNGA